MSVSSTANSVQTYGPTTKTVTKTTSHYERNASGELVEVSRTVEETVSPLGYEDPKVNPWAWPHQPFRQPTPWWQSPMVTHGQPDTLLH